MFCPQCGAEINTSKKFCTNCGWKIEVSELKEEVKKFIPKEIAKKELKKEKKEVSLSNKSLQKKYGSFFGKLSSNLKQQTVPIKDDKNQLTDEVKPIKKRELSVGIKENFKKNKKFSILIVSLGAIFIGLAGVIVSNDSFLEDKYVESNDWFNDYLNSDGNCCSREFYLVDNISAQALVINDILKFNPYDSQALEELERINANSFLKKERERFKTFGRYSMEKESVNLDKNFFKQNKIISYEAVVSNKKNPFEETNFSFICSTRERYDWKKQKWRVAKNDELGMIKLICRSKKYDPELISLLKEDEWQEYSTSYESSFVDVKSWEVIKGEDYINYETNYYFPTIQTRSKIAVNCSRREVAFLQENEWTNWETASDTDRQILEDKCNSSNNEILKIPY